MSTFNKFGQLKTDRPFNCRDCGHEGQVGDTRLFDNKRKTVVCPQCAEKQGYVHFKGDVEPVDDMDRVIFLLRETRERLKAAEVEIANLKERICPKTPTETSAQKS